MAGTETHTHTITGNVDSEGYRLKTNNKKSPTFNLLLFLFVFFPATQLGNKTGRLIVETSIPREPIQLRQSILIKVGVETEQQQMKFPARLQQIC